MTRHGLPVPWHEPQELQGPLGGMVGAAVLVPEWFRFAVGLAVGLYDNMTPNTTVMSATTPINEKSTLQQRFLGFLY